jgi:carbon storage regulator CsrA
MLVISRKTGEEITLTLPDGRTIVVKVKKIQGQAAKIGIQAPKDIQISRLEKDTQSWEVKE